MGGVYRSSEEGLSECQIDGAGMVEPYGAFSGPAELGQLLVDEGEIEDCVTRQLFTFAVGRELVGNEEEAVMTLLEAFRGSDYSLPDLLLAFVEHEAFARRLEPGSAP